ncbi:hypothetical protein BD779DRAFT_1773601 [Infundibulicybe gibba]|nr:hypothetical protein BD779DRAFT_1773601 [Infundibulicybe gibba]
MVLQSNFAKRPSTENNPPASQISGATKSLASRIGSSLRDAARRRRARTNGSSRTTKYIVEQAKRRETTKSPVNSIRLNVTTIRTADVDMKDARPSSSSLGVATVPVTLPRQLARPQFAEVSEDALRAVAPEIADADIEYVREQLEEFGPSMLQVLSSVKANLVSHTLPKELAIVVQDLADSIVPTHMMAVYGPPSKTGSSKPANMILAAHCTRLPSFPPTPASSAESSKPGEFSVPVRPLCLPSPQTFPHLSAFLYTKRADLLLNALLPCPPPAPLAEDAPELVAFATRLAGTYTSQALLNHAMSVFGLWQNVCALGVFEDRLWDTIDVAWKLLLTAIAVGTGNPQAMLPQA